MGCLFSKHRKYKLYTCSHCKNYLNAIYVVYKDKKFHMNCYKNYIKVSFLK